jgi:pimeloyl-ACP methyl ester carboxylesterase
MSNYTHQTAPTQFVEANSIRFAYRRFGKTGGVPLVFCQHYIGTMDYWDPTVTDGLARDREVILFNNAGVSSSSGEVPTTFEQKQERNFYEDYFNWRKRKDRRTGSKGIGGC